MAKAEVINSKGSLFKDGPPEIRYTPTGISVHIYVYGEIENELDFVDAISTLDSLSENDEAHVHLNTPGGDVNAAIGFIHAIQRCRAVVYGHADGQVASAGTIIFFSCTQYMIYPFSHWMFHDGSFGSISKVNEHLKHAVAVSNLLANLYYTFLYPVFSEEEIQQILNGADFYLGSEDMLDRIEAAVEKLKAEEEENDGLSGEDECGQNSNNETKQRANRRTTKSNRRKR